MKPNGLDYFKKRPGVAHFDEGGGAGEGGSREATDARNGMGFGGTGSGIGGDNIGAGRAGSEDAGGSYGYSYNPHLANLMNDVGPSLADLTAAPVPAPAPATTKPGEDATAAAVANAYAAMTPQQMSDMAHVLNLPAGPNYTYNFNNPGIPEAITNALYVSPSDPAFAYGIRAPGVTSDQTFNDETAAQKDTRMQNVSDALGNIGQGLVGLTPMATPFNIAKAVAGVASGEQTPGDALSNVAFGLVGKALGVPSSVAQSALAGDLGGAAQGVALSLLTKDVANATGISVPAVSLLGNLTGATKELGTDIKNTVNDVTGDTSTGITKASVSDAINNALAGLMPEKTGNDTSVIGDSYANLTPEQVDTAYANMAGQDTNPAGAGSFGGDTSVIDNAYANLTPTPTGGGSTDVANIGTPSPVVGGGGGGGGSGTVAATPSAGTTGGTSGTGGIPAIGGVSGTGGASQVAAVAPAVQDNVARAGTGFDVEGAFDPQWFSKYVANKSNGLVANPVKIASGGYLDSLMAQPTSFEDLLRTLRK